MTYYGSQELAQNFRTVRANTITVAEDIPEDKYSFQAAPDTRSVAQTLVHIALSPQMHHQVHGVERRTSLDGFDFPSFVQRVMAEEQQPRSKAEIINLLRQEGDRFAGWMEGLSEEFLAEEVAMRTGMTPAFKSRFEMILSVKEHEMHHRAQLMLIERLLGIVPHLTRVMQARMAEVMRTARA